MTTETWHTRLAAEDGVYYKHHDSKGEAEKYVHYQLAVVADTPEKLYQDEYGRTMSYFLASPLDVAEFQDQDGGLYN